MIHQAIQLATACHQRQTRKGTNVPYVLHCTEAGMIASQLVNDNGTIDEAIVAAAILHDTMEDAFLSYVALEAMFTTRVADLVQSQSENKANTWRERKEATIAFIANEATWDEEVITLADKLSNMRAIARDYAAYGDAFWTKFNAGKEKQQWYYTSLANAFRHTTQTREYAEYRALLAEVFGEAA